MLRVYGKKVWNAYKHYIKGVDACNVDRYKTLKDIEKYLKPESYVIETFIWRYTNEMYDFWSKINRRWQDECEKQ